MKLIFNFVLYCLVSRSALFNTITLIHIFDPKHTGGLEHRKYESKATSRAILVQGADQPRQRLSSCWLNVFENEINIDFMLQKLHPPLPT